MWDCYPSFSVAAFIAPSPIQPFIYGVLVGGIVVFGVGLLALIGLIAFIYRKSRNFAAFWDKLSRTTLVVWHFWLTVFWAYRRIARTTAGRLTQSAFLVVGILTMSDLLLKLAIYIERYLNFSSSALPKEYSLLLSHLQAFGGSFQEAMIRGFENPSVLIPLLIMEILIFRHHSQARRHEARLRASIAIFQLLFTPLHEYEAQSKLSTNPTQELKNKKWFFHLFSEALQQTLGLWGISDVNICLMEYDAGAKTLYIFDDSSGGIDFDQSFTLKPGQGAAGAALQRGASVYLPNVQHEHGIFYSNNRWGLLNRVYAPSRHPFASILSVPVDAAVGKDNLPGKAILNLSSRKKDAFSDDHFLIAEIATKFLGMMYTA